MNAECLSSTEFERLNQIQSADFLSISARVSVLLVTLGKVPAWFGDFDTSQNVEDFFGNLELCWCKTALQQEGRKRVFIGRSLDDAKTLQLALTSQPIDHYTAGVFLGYPESAVKGFCNGNLLQLISPSGQNVLRCLLATDEYEEMMAFLPMRLSANHWREELVHAKQIAQTVRYFAPQMYEEAIERVRL